MSAGRSTERSPDLEGFVVPLYHEFVKRLAQDIAAQLAASAPRYADAGNNPLGTRRAFLAAGRRGDFPTFRRGREVVALWADVEAFIESRRRPVRARTPAQETGDDRVLLERSGIRLRGRP